MFLEESNSDNIKHLHVLKREEFEPFFKRFILTEVVVIVIVYYDERGFTYSDDL